MQAISVDLPWGSRGEAAIVTVDQDGRAAWDFCEYPEGLIERLHGKTDALVLLDIPIYGLDRLVNRGFRRIDRALQCVGIPLRPSTGARTLGWELMRRMVAEAGVVTERVREIYPYAVYKVLDYLRHRRHLGSLAREQVGPLLNRDFLSHWPLPYKRSSWRGTRRQGMEALYRVLTQPDLRLDFWPPLPSPEGQKYGLKRTGDIYDAALGAVLGLHLLREDGWAVVKGDEEHGDMALLADSWLAGRIDHFLATDAGRE